MITNVRFLVMTILIVASTGCKKSCSDPNALNNGKDEPCQYLSGSFVGSYHAVDSMSQVFWWGRTLSTVDYTFSIKQKSWDKVEITNLLKCTDYCEGIVDTSRQYVAFEIRQLPYCDQTLTGRFLFYPSKDTLRYSMRLDNNNSNSGYYTLRWGYAVKGH